MTNSDQEKRLLWVTRYGWILILSLSYLMMLFCMFTDQGAYDVTLENIAFASFVFLYASVPILLMSATVYSLTRILRFVIEVQGFLFALEVAFALYVGHWISQAIVF